MNGHLRQKSNFLPIVVCLVIASLFRADSLGADDQVETRDLHQHEFHRDIEPILRAHCLECHGPDQREGGLLLTTGRTARLTNDSGRAALVPFRPEESELIRRVTSTNPDKRMPPETQLSDQQIDQLRAWIRAGAEWPSSHEIDHWAYISPRPSRLPAVKQKDWPNNAVDYYVLARMEGDGLRPVDEEMPERLLRRLYLDLIGLPPTPSESAAFLNDTSPGAYERVVDRLLASKAYGEKWARHWLDLARYSDSNGYQADQLREMWAFRDWVIEAMNQDMGFDQFTIEQVAGDLLPGATISQRIATGFHRATTCNVEAGVDPEGNRTDQVIDRVNTTATVWLGTTLECAQCHNHKYDPFSQRDYYQLFAFFNNTPLEVRQSGAASGVRFDFWGPKLILPDCDNVYKRRPELETRLRQANQTLQSAEQRAIEAMPAWEISLDDASKAALHERLRRVLAIEPAERSQDDQAELLKGYLDIDPEVARLRESVKQLQTELDELEPSSTLVMAEMSQARKTHIFVRGDYQNQGLEVHPMTPAALHPFPEDAPPNRLGLAHWLTDNRNPLIGRVTVNRWWQEFFGQGLVLSLEDFGAQADPPTHPKLLDWLACELVRQDWSMKSIHRLLVTSATYRQSSRIGKAQASKDPLNRRYARMARFRLPAETIRDSALAASGLLSRRMGGPPVFPPQPDGLWRQTGRNEPVFRADTDERRFRRGVYVIWRRAAPYPSFVNFDAPDRMSCVVSRPETNTPLQALTLLNDETYVELAKALALRTMRECQGDIDKRLTFAFRLCLARLPQAAELSTLRALFCDERKRFSNDVEAVRQLAQNQPGLTCFDTDELVDWAAMFCVANALLNLDEMITRG